MLKFPKQMGRIEHLSVGWKPTVITTILHLHISAFIIENVTLCGTGFKKRHHIAFTVLYYLYGFFLTFTFSIFIIAKIFINFKLFYR